jgi:uncharacterized protein
VKGRGRNVDKGEHPGGEWFEGPDPVTGERGLRFGCTMCGNCCSGPEGYVLVSDAEGRALAARLGVTHAEFLERYTHLTSKGRSLTEKRTDAGNDCVFLDRETIPGKAICSVYDDRPEQCRTWPFWPSVVGTRLSWQRHKQVCPGMDKGTLVPPEQIRILRDRFSI